MRTLATAFAIIHVVLPGIALGDVELATKRAKAGDVDAVSDVPCAQEVGQTLGICTASVSRSTEFAAAVVVKFPNGFARRLTFSNGSFLRGNPTMSGSGTDTEWHLADGVFHIRVDDQRFEIPEALVRGD